MDTHTVSFFLITHSLEEGNESRKVTYFSVTPIFLTLSHFLCFSYIFYLLHAKKSQWDNYICLDGHGGCS